MRALLHRVLPVLAVKIFCLQHREVNVIDAARIDIDLVRFRAWHIERMDAAVQCVGVRSSLPRTNSNRSGGTIRWMIPLLVQIEQLQMMTVLRSAMTRKRTRSQWQPPSYTERIHVVFGLLNCAHHVCERSPTKNLPYVFNDANPIWMSALGQKQTYVLQQAMSAPIATSIASFSIALSLRCALRKRNLPRAARSLPL
jgi:hypothetical protein